MNRMLAHRSKVVLVLAALACAVGIVWAGNPHFVEVNVFRIDNTNTLCSDGKEAGLGDEAQVTIQLSATASCINPGDHHPKAANKLSTRAFGDVPVQNGKADWPPPSICVTATFQPDCSPPMSVVFSDVTVTDTTNGVSEKIPGVF